MFPEDVETITMTKEDYDRNVEQLLVEKLELEHKYNLMKKNAYQLAIRIDKAIEYINENKHLSMFADCREPEEDWNYDLEINPRELLEILKGEDKE